MQAIILAAGMGKRLKQLTQNVTKCMVSVNGVTLIERMLRQLENYNLSKIVLVVGYKAEKLISFVETLNLRTPIVYIENKEFDKTNNIYSLFLAKEYLKEEDTLLLESDLIFENSILDKVVKNKNKSLAVVAKFENWMDGTVVTVDNKNQITGMFDRKHFDFYKVDEYYKTVNIYKFSKNFSNTQYIPFLNAYCSVMGRNEYYEQVLKIITMLEKTELRALCLENEKWYEIDDIQDLNIAETIFSDFEERYEKLCNSYGGYWRYSQLQDFCYLVNPYFPNEKLLNEIKSNFNTLIMNYPSGQVINNLLIQKYFGLEEGQACVGNGAAELIKELMHNLEGNFGRILPTFEEYGNRLDRSRLVDYIPADYHYSIDEIIQFFDEHRVDNLIFINPDNPSGNYVEFLEMMKLIKWGRRQNVTIIVDESFIDFTIEKGSLLRSEILKEYRNLVVIKSISKSYGVPGIRLGILATGNKDLLKKVERELSIWNINSVAEFYLQIYEKHKEQYFYSLEKIIKARENFIAKLSTLECLKVFPSQANYIMCEVKGERAHKFCVSLLKHNVFIKDLSGKAGITGECIRIAVKTEEENDALYQILLKEKQCRKNHWKDIWAKKQADEEILNKSKFELFCYLKKKNGFDVNVKDEKSYYESFYRAEEELVLTISQYAKQKIESVYEVGCGSGVNLFMFREKNKNIQVGGIDYSQGLINLAGTVIDSADLVCGEARDIEIFPQYDAVISESVFQYFPNLDYAEEVLRKMICKSKHVTYLGEIHDESKKEEWLENRRRNMQNYDELYEGLGRMFYQKEWLERIAADYGKQVLYTAVQNDEYWSSKYIYNCYIY